MKKRPTDVQFLQKIFISPTDGRLRSGWRLLAFLFLLFLVIPLVVWIFTGLSGVSPALAFLADQNFIGFVGITISVVLARHWYDRRSFQSLGLTWNAAAGRDLLFGVLIAGVVMGAIFLAEWAFGWLSVSGFASESNRSGPVAELGYWAAIFIFVGWNEELLFRGYGMQNLIEGLGAQIGLFVSSALFALAHLANPNATWAAILGLLAAGYFLAFGYLRTRQLWLPIGLHIGWNFFEGPIFSFPVSGLKTFRLLNVTVRGPELFTGGAFGPEAGLIVLPALALGAALIVLYTNKFHRPAKNKK